MADTSTSVSTGRKRQRPSTATHGFWPHRPWQYDNAVTRAAVPQHPQVLHSLDLVALAASTCHVFDHLVCLADEHLAKLVQLGLDNDERNNGCLEEPVVPYFFYVLWRPGALGAAAGRTP